MVSAGCMLFEALAARDHDIAILGVRPLNWPQHVPLPAMVSHLNPPVGKLFEVSSLYRNPLWEATREQLK